MPKIFISHASEDKESFVGPLAVELRNHMEVWFDEFELKLGASLRSSIDNGLRTSDFGVVVLSPHFFGKKWTVAEVNGLFALEDANRKIILPVWYSVDEKAVRDFSPILADRLAVDAAKGLSRVVEEIKIAVGVSQRAKEVLVPGKAAIAVRRMAEQIESWELDSQVLKSGRGLALVAASQSRIESQILERLQSVNTPETQRFARQQRANYFILNGPFRVSVALYLDEAFVNTVADARLVAKLYLRPSDFGANPERIDLHEFSWSVTCLGPDKIGYRAAPGLAVLTEEEVATHIIERVCTQVIDQLHEHQNSQQ